MHQRLAGQAADEIDLLAVERGRRETVAGEMAGQLLRRPALAEHQMRGEHHPRRRRGAEPREMPVEPQLLPDRAPGEIGNRAPIVSR